MLDEKKMTDFKFVTHPFTNDANGKMMLSVAFAISKQYSDDLSQKVTRGSRNKFAEGKSSVPKYGYITTVGGIYQPDGKNFDLIQNAWGMRKSGTSFEEISDYMNKNGYSKVIKTTGRLVKMDFLD